MDKKPILLWVSIAFGAMVLACGGIMIMIWPQVMDKFGGLQTDRCQNRLQSLYTASQLYTTNNNDHLMIAGQWMDEVAPLLQRRSALHCPAFGSEGRKYGYAFNSKLSQTSYQGIVKAADELIYDSANVSRNASDPGTSLPPIGRHRREADRGNDVLLTTGKVIFEPKK